MIPVRMPVSSLEPWLRHLRSVVRLQKLLKEKTFRNSLKIHHCSKKLGIKNGETTANGKFSLLKVECLGSCGTAPVVQLNEDYHENMTVEKLDRLLDSLE